MAHLDVGGQFFSAFYLKETKGEKFFKGLLNFNFF